MKMAIRTCRNCGINFKVAKSHLRKRPALFCTPECRRKSMAAPTVERNCGYCGKPFKVAEWDTNRRPAQFCSWVCRNKGRMQPPSERFWNTVTKTDTCWIWTGTIDRNGYGMITEPGKRHAAHRLSYEMHKGPIPKGLNVCHKCDNPPCVNPDHLFVGTTQDNIDDKTIKGRAAVKLTAADVLEIRSSVDDGVSSAILAREYEVTPNLIRKIATRKIWKHI